MGYVNKVFLMGNLTRDPELRYAPNGTAVASFGIAVNREWKSSEGEQKKETCFVDVTSFGKTAELIGEYFSKGKPIFIEGRLRFEQWETKDGQKRSTLRVIAENFQFIGPRTSVSPGQKTVLEEAVTPAESGSDNFTDDVSSDKIPF